MMEKSTFTAIAQALGVNLYTDPQRMNAKFSAQDQLGGRTHYCDESTLRFFRARILAASPQFGGLFFRTIESTSKDFNNTERGMRCVLFDLMGETVYRPKLEEMSRTREQALKAFWKWADGFNPETYYRDLMVQRADKLTAQAAALRELAGAL